MDTLQLLRDDFDSISLDRQLWQLPLVGPSSFVGNTQFRLTEEPVVSNSIAYLRFDTFNPILNDDSDALPSFYGSEIITNERFNQGSGLAFEARVRLEDAIASGIIASLFSFVTNGTIRDELTFEFLTNDINNGQERVLTVAFDDAAFNQAGDREFISIEELDLTEFNIFRIEWSAGLVVQKSRESLILSLLSALFSSIKFRDFGKLNATLHLSSLLA